VGAWHERSWSSIRRDERIRGVYGLLELIVQVARDGHFFDPVDSLPGGLFFKGNRCVLAPLFKGTLREERGKNPIIPNYRVVDDVVEEPGQPSSTPVVVSKSSAVRLKWLPTSVVQGNSHRLQAR